MTTSSNHANIKPEIEASFLDIDKDALCTKIKSLGGKLLLPETLMRRVVFNTSPHSFARVRDEGNRITMTYKYVDELSLSGSKEINLTVDSYDEAIAFVKACGLSPKAEQETKREEWQLDDVELDIDTWPGLPTFVEIEGPSEASVKSVAKKLGFRMEDAHYGSVDQVYKYYYGVDNDAVNTCPVINFSSLPAFLVGKTRLH